MSHSAHSSNAEVTPPTPGLPAGWAAFSPPRRLLDVDRVVAALLDGRHQSLRSAAELSQSGVRCPYFYVRWYCETAGARAAKAQSAAIKSRVMRDYCNRLREICEEDRRLQTRKQTVLQLLGPIEPSLAALVSNIPSNTPTAPLVRAISLLERWGSELDVPHGNLDVWADSFIADICRLWVVLTGIRPSPKNILFGRLLAAGAAMCGKHLDGGFSHSQIRGVMRRAQDADPNWLSRPLDSPIRGGLELRLENFI